MAIVAYELQPPNPFASSQMVFEELLRRLASQQSSGLTHSELEEDLNKAMYELGRHLYEECLNSRGPGHVGPAIKGSDDVVRTPGRQSRGRNLESLFGTVRLARLPYSAEGHNSLHPLDKELNLPQGKYSFPLRKRVCLEVARTSFEEAIDTVERTTGAHMPKRQAEEIAQGSAVDFDAFYAERCSQAREQGGTLGQPLLVLTTDGKGIPMLKEALRPATRRAARQRSHRLRPGEKGKKRRKHSKREAVVASVYGVEPYVRTAEEVIEELWREGEGPQKQRPRPQNKAVWASVEKDRKAVIEDLFEEAESRDPEHRAQWLVLLDGLEHPIELIKAEAKARGIELTLILDLMHALGYLWEGASTLLGKGSEETDAQVRHWTQKLLEGGVNRVAAAMRRSATLQGLAGKQRKKVDTCADYLLNHQHMMRYDRYLAAGYPIATGVIEGGCRYLVKDRMERTGARWGLCGSEAVLQLRALWINADFDEYWNFHLQQEYEHNHASKYGPPPTPEELPAPSRPRLRLVV